MTTFTKILSGAAVVALLPLSAFANTSATTDTGFDRSGRLSAPIRHTSNADSVATNYSYDRRGEIVPNTAQRKTLLKTESRESASDRTYDRRGEFVTPHANGHNASHFE